MITPPPLYGPPPLYTVERYIARGPGWAVFTVDLAGGVGPRASDVFEDRGPAERWARVHGILVEPLEEAA